MKKFLVIIISLLFVCPVFGQTSFNAIMIMGRTKLVEENYPEALRIFEKARAVALTKNEVSVAEGMISKCHNAIQEIERKKKEEERLAREIQLRMAEDVSKEDAPNQYQDGYYHTESDTDRLDSPDYADNQSQPLPEDEEILYEEDEVENMPSSKLVSAMEFVDCVTVSELEICNYDRDEQLIGSTSISALKASDVCWLGPWIKYKTWVDYEVQVNLDLKFYDTNGTLVDLTGCGAPIVYSISETYSFLPGKERNICLFMWGADVPGTFVPGEYIIEIWSDGSIIFKTSFFLE